MSVCYINIVIFVQYLSFNSKNLHPFKMSVSNVKTVILCDVVPFGM